MKLMLSMALAWLGIAVLGMTFDNDVALVIGLLGSVVNSVGLTMIREIKGNKKGSN